METRFEEEKGWNPLGNAKQEREKPQIALAAGEKKEEEKEWIASWKPVNRVLYPWHRHLRLGD
jgi:hypothetical protein